MKRPDNDTIIEVFQNSCGLVKLAAEKLNVNRCTIYSWWEKDPELKEKCDCYRREMIDLAKSAIKSNIESENIAVKQRAAEFILERLSKAEFSQRQEIDANVNNINITNDWGDKQEED